MTDQFALADSAAQLILQRTPLRPRIALVLGQFEEGLGVSHAHVRRLGIVRH